MDEAKAPAGTAGVRVMLVGAGPWPALPYEILHVERSASIVSSIARFDPDVVLTRGGNWPGPLKLAPFEVRKRWLDLPKGATREEAISAVEGCYRQGLWATHAGESETPLVSVYTPTRDTGDYLREAYRSLLDQTYPNWEWVVLDDESSDGTWERLLEYAKEDPRVRPFRSGKRLGKIGRVKDAATRLAYGEFLVELDHDDMLTDFALAEVVKAFRSDPAVGMVYSNCACVFEDGSPHTFAFEHFKDRYRETEYRGRRYQECRAFDMYGRHGPRWWERNSYWLTVGPNHVRCYRASTLRELGGYNRNLPVADDLDLFMRFFLRSKCAHVDRMLYIYRYLDNWQNTTFRRNKSIQDHVRLAQAHRAAEYERYDAEHPDPAPAFDRPFDVPCRAGLVSIVLATRARPEGLCRMVESAFATAEEPASVEVVAYVDDDDAAGAEALKGLATRFPLRHTVGPRGKLSLAYNSAARLAAGEILHLSADDVVYRTKGWDALVRAEFRKVPDGVLLVYGPDGDDRKERKDLPTHPFLGRAWVEAVGYLQPPCFSGWYGDDWLDDLAARIGRKVRVPGLLVEHMHFSNGKAAMDETYRGMASRSPSEYRLLEDLKEERGRDAARLQAAFRSTADISYVVPTVAPGPLLLRCLDSVRRWSPGSEVVLVAQGCAIPPEVEGLADRVVRLPANLRWSAGCNRGAAEATRKFLCLLNDDAEFVDETPLRLVRAITLWDPVVGPYSDRAKHPQGDIPFERCPRESIHPEMVVGVCLMLPREAYLEIGGLDPRLDNFDDDDLCLRFRQIMLGCTVVGGAWVRHAGSASFQALGEDVSQAIRSSEAIFRRMHPRVRVVAIAKDEEGAIGGFLQQFRELTNELCLLDTGSTDRTRAIAEGLGAKTERGAEIGADHGFADARNEALSRFSRGADWVVTLDPDERLDRWTLEGLRGLLFSTAHDILLAPLDAVYPDGSRKAFVPKPFAHRVKPGIEWTLKVHEKLVGGSMGLVANAKIEHMVGCHDEGRRGRAEGLYRALMANEPYFTDPAAKRRLVERWPVLDYDRMDDVRIARLHIGPLVSVVIPTYRRPELLAKAVGSALAQDYANLEVVVVGDGDPDFRPPSGPRTRSVNLNRNHGTGGAVPRNVGISLAAGSWIAYLDDDNEWLPDHVSSVMAEVRRTGASWGFSSMSVDGKDLGFTRPAHRGIDTSCVVHPRDFARRYGWWKTREEAGTYAHDWEFIARFAEREKWACSRRPTLLYNAETSGQRGFLRGVAAAARSPA